MHKFRCRTQQATPRKAIPICEFTLFEFQVTQSQKVITANNNNDTYNSFRKLKIKNKPSQRLTCLPNNSSRGNLLESLLISGRSPPRTASSQTSKGGQYMNVYNRVYREMFQTKNLFRLTGGLQMIE